MDALGHIRTSLADRYRIERELGAGGMATVYLAADLKHDRKVAIKVLKPELAAVLGAERFVVEIKTTASLQHPHILPLFDSGEAGGQLFYVMPYIQGETIREKLDRETQFGVDDAIRIAREIADALDYAHRHGVIHRDIKPENVLLHDGRAMVMDFGIALAVSAAAGGRMTETGLSLGTPHYMSPEQATAEKEISGRSDVYSLATVLYEMLAGTPPFTGAAAQQIIMKIITEPAAPVTKYRKSVPGNVAMALERALEKLPADRFATAREFANALGDAQFRGTSVSSAPITATQTGWRHRIAVPALAVAALLMVGLGWSAWRPTSPLAVARYRVDLPDGQKLSGSQWSRLAVSQDGSTLVYVVDNQRSTGLVVRRRDHLQGTLLPGTDGAINPSISPDGKSVAFRDNVTGGSLKAVQLSGGPAIVLTDSVVGAPGVSWGYDGYVYYDRQGIGPLMRVSEKGGRAESVSRLDTLKGEMQHAWPDALPNGKGVLITVSHGGPGAMGVTTDEIAVLDLATGTHRVLVPGLFGRYAKSGHLVYATIEGALMAVAFDLKKMQLAGEPVKLEESLSVRLGSGAVDLTISGNGTLWYASGGVANSGTFEPVWVTREGVATPVAAGWWGLIADPALSPDGRQVAVSVRALDAQIFIRDLQQGTLSRLTTGASVHVRPAWTHDGKSVAFITVDGTHRRIDTRIADGSRPASALIDEAADIDGVEFSRDGRWIVYGAGQRFYDANIHARRIGSSSTIDILKSPRSESSPALSPDGRWLAYVSMESGAREVYVSPFPNVSDRRWQVSLQGGQEPVWAPSGRELFYRVAETNSQMVMSVLPGATFMPGPRRVVFPLTRYQMDNGHPQYAVAPDGRFLMIRATETGRVDAPIAVENFFEVLKAKVPRR